MRRVLHILTHPVEPPAAEVIRRQRDFPEHEVEVLELTHCDPNYEQLLEKIFQADSIQVW